MAGHDGTSGEKQSHQWHNHDEFETISTWPPIDSYGPREEKVNTLPPENNCENRKVNRKYSDVNILEHASNEINAWPPDDNCENKETNLATSYEEKINSWPPETNSTVGNYNTKENSVNRIINYVGKEVNVDNTNNPAKNLRKNLKNCEDSSIIDNISSTSNKRMKTEFSGQTARVGLAVWLRRNHKTLTPLNIPANISAKSKLNFAAGTKVGKQYLQDKLRELESSEDLYSESSDFYYVLATYCDFLQIYKKAEDYCKKSLELSDVGLNFLNECSTQVYLSKLDSMSDCTKNALWLYSRLRYQSRMLEKCPKNDLRTLKGDSANHLKIDRVDAKDLSIERFQSEFCSNRKAVIICNAECPTPKPWTLQHIREMCGESRVAVKTPSTYSTEWANLEEAESKNIAAFIDQKIRDHYLFDWSLPLNAPALAEEFQVHKYFQENILMHTSESSLYRQSWPSLFLGPRGTGSGLHIDAFGSHFWMYLISGVKKWTFYPPEEAGNLSPIFSDSMDPVFRPTQQQLETVSCYSIDLQPGELLFVPAGSPHKVENLEDTIAVSGNFVNGSNLTEFETHLRINASQDPRSRDLLAELHTLNIIS